MRRVGCGAANVPAMTDKFQQTLHQAQLKTPWKFVRRSKF